MKIFLALVSCCAVALTTAETLVEHEYGNYVLQALIRRAAPEQRQALLDQVVRGGPGVERSRDYSRIVLSRIAPSA